MHCQASPITEITLSFVYGVQDIHLCDSSLTALIKLA